ncbi:MAG: leucine-rich repeat protein [Fermentimonas sp.]|jgi:hypothetical protein
MKKNRTVILICSLLMAWSISPAMAKKVEIIVKTGDFSNLTKGTPKREAAEKKIASYNLQEGDDLVFKGSMNKGDFEGMKLLMPRETVYNSIDISGLEITEYTDNYGEVHPAKVVPVQAFLTNENLKAKKIVMGNNIEGIGTRAFAQRVNENTLTEIVMPSNSLKVIGAWAFQNVIGLNSFTLPESVTEIGMGAFSSFNWPGITSLTLPKGLKKLGAENFAYTKLTEVILPDGLEEMGGKRTFSNSKLTSFRFPDVVKIVDYVPTYVSRDPVLNVLEGTFEYSNDLTSVTNIPKSVTKLIGTFNGTKLTQIELHEGITEISKRAFPRTMTSITLPSTLTTLENMAFMGLNQIETLELPANVDTIADMALYNMTNLKKLVVHNPNPDVLKYWRLETVNGKKEWVEKESKNVFYGITKEGNGACVLYVPAEAVDAYRNARLWGEFKTIEAIGSDAKTQTIENFEDITAFVGDEPITLGATSSAEGRPISYVLEKGKEAIATIDGNVLTIKGSGTAKITAKAEGNFEWLAAEKTITLTVRDYTWLQAPAIAIDGNKISVVGPGKEAFTKITINGKEGNELKEDTKGEVKIVATSADGKQSIRLIINR